MNPKDRIGKGPWRNAKGVVVAKDIAEPHGNNYLTRQTALTEKGDVVNGRGDTPNKHDVLTGSRPDGTGFAAREDKTCGNWTKSGEGSAIVGHSDRTGLDTTPPSLSVELVARDSRVQRSGAGIERRRRAALLLRGELTE